VGLRSPKFRTPGAIKSLSNSFLGDIFGALLAAFTNLALAVYGFGETIVDVIKEVNHIAIDAVVDVHIELTELAGSTTDALVGSEFEAGTLVNAAEGARWVSHGIVEGDKNAILMGAILAASIALAVLSAGAATGLVMTAIAYISVAYTIYNVTMTLAELGEMITQRPDLFYDSYGNLTMQYMHEYWQSMRDAMNLNIALGFITGSIYNWYPGQLLYDAPRAGDILFAADGAQDTVMFYGGQNNNIKMLNEVNVTNRYSEPWTNHIDNLAGENDFNWTTIT